MNILKLCILLRILWILTACHLFRIRSCPDPNTKWFFPDPGPDPAKSFGFDRIHNTVIVCKAMQDMTVVPVLSLPWSIIPSEGDFSSMVEARPTGGYWILLMETRRPLRPSEAAGLLSPASSGQRRLLPGGTLSHPLAKVPEVLGLLISFLQQSNQNTVFGADVPLFLFSASHNMVRVN